MLLVHYARVTLSLDKYCQGKFFEHNFNELIFRYIFTTPLGQSSLWDRERIMGNDESIHLFS